MRPRILILHATGTNRDREAARACLLAGGAPEIVHLHKLLEGGAGLGDYQMLVLPGGFSYGDDLGAGKVWSVLLRERLGEQLQAFVAAGRPVLGICNGFQVLVKAGLLPGPSDEAGATFTEQRATLTRNASARFECRWVWLQPDPASNCVFTRGLGDTLIHCPIAHGEGRFVAGEAMPIDRLQARGQVALRYVDAAGDSGNYPVNPNGSDDDIAGICNAAGNVLGLMPHPEDHIIDLQHPRRHRGERGGLGLALFESGVAYAAEL